MDSETIRWIFTGLMGVIMWFWKHNIDGNTTAVAMLKAEIQHLKDTRLHKDDFREFKHELRAQFEEIKIALKELKHSGN